MEAAGGRRAVLCHGHPRLAGLARASLIDAGFTVVAEPLSARAVEHTILAHRPDLAVLDLARCGEGAVGLLRRLHRQVPECLLIVLSPFDTLDLVVLEAGAHLVLPIDDVWSLRRVLLDPDLRPDDDLRPDEDSRPDDELDPSSHIVDPRCDG